MLRLALSFVALSLAGSAIAGHYYDSDNPGHGITVQDAGDQYVAQWYFHDGDQTRWVASDACEYGDPCPVWTVDANRFPAVGSDLVEAGEITLILDGNSLLVDYSIDIAEVTCGLMPGPLPPECRPGGSGVLVPGFKESGVLDLDLLAE